MTWVRWHTHQGVLLLLDGAHRSDECIYPKGQGTVITYPPKCPSEHQPVDIGVTSAMNRLRPSKLPRIRVTTMGHLRELREQAKKWKMVAGTAILAEGHPANLRDAAEILMDAWDDVSAIFIAR